MKVLLCGGGNAIHVLTSYVSSLEDTDVYILSLFPGEADRLRDSIECTDKGIKCINDLGDDVYGRPVKISEKAQEVAPGADVVILAIPSFTHELYLKALKPYLQQGVTLGAMPGEGGFDLCAIHNLGSEFVRHSNLFALETLPWACRIVEYGKSVEVLGTKKEVEVIISPKEGSTIEPTLALLQKLVGKLPEMDPACNFLAVTLMNINSVWYVLMILAMSLASSYYTHTFYHHFSLINLRHPTISYGFYRNRDITEPFDEPPLFYQGADEYTGEKLAKVSDEVLQVKRVLLEKYGEHLDLSSLHHVSEWMIRSYGDDIGDKTSIYTMLHTNKGYRGLTHPMIEIDTPEGGKQYLPNFKYRYVQENTRGFTVVFLYSNILIFPLGTIRKIFLVALS